MTLLMQAVGLIQEALPGLPPGGPMHSDALKSLTRLSRHVSQGQPTAGVQLNQLGDLMRNIMRNGLLQRIMGQQGGGGAPGGAGGGAGGPGGPAPMPSTPLPGA
jgi:hypothetical protein